MTFTPKSADIANELRVRIQQATATIGEGEAVAMLVLWSFFLDHAQVNGVDVETLARHQIDAFIQCERGNVTIARPH